MKEAKPFLTKFSKRPPETAYQNSSKSPQDIGITPIPRPTILTEVRNETTDDN